MKKNSKRKKLEFYFSANQSEDMVELMKIKGTKNL